VRDREAGATDPGRIRFTPSILPPYARRSRSREVLILDLDRRLPGGVVSFAWQIIFAGNC
jgi:hypothetical protein